jgi:hypothetical protein
MCLRKRMAARAVGVLAGLLAGLLAISAQAMPAAEQAKAQALLLRVETATDAVFIRNGSQYSAANAAEFLRRKCAKAWDKLASAREFIGSCASQSSTSGKPYLISIKGAAPRPSAEVLTEWLETMERNAR